MPKKIDGIPLTKHEHKIFSATYASTQNYSMATAKVQEYRKNKNKKSKEKK